MYVIIQTEIEQFVRLLSLQFESSIAVDDFFSMARPGVEPGKGLFIWMGRNGPSRADDSFVVRIDDMGIEPVDDVALVEPYLSSDLQMTWGVPRPHQPLCMVDGAAVQFRESFYSHFVRHFPLH